MLIRKVAICISYNCLIFNTLVPKKSLDAQRCLEKNIVWLRLGKSHVPKLFSLKFLSKVFIIVYRVGTIIYGLISGLNIVEVAHDNHVVIKKYIMDSPLK